MKSFIAIGANESKPLRVINKALRIFQKENDIKILNISSLYKTEAVGGPQQKDYLNGVFSVESCLPPQDLMGKLLEIEKRLGRVRRVKWGPRILDLDLLATGSLVFRSKRLTLPHPRYHLRRFVLVPFCDVAPRFVHPHLKVSNKRLLSKLTLPGQRVTIAALWNGTRFVVFKKKRKTKSPSSH